MGRPGTAFDHFFSGAVDDLAPFEVREIRLLAGSLVRAMHPACFGVERRARLTSFAAVLDGDVAPPDFARRPHCIAFPIVMPDDEGRDAFVDVTVSLGGAGRDEVLRHERLDPAAAAAVRDALTAVRARFPTGKTFVVALPDLDIAGASLGLAVALAAVSALTGWPIDERYAVTGRVGAGGQIAAVGHVDRKRELRARERPASHMLGPAEGLLSEEGWTGVASLEDAVAQVFGPDLAAARRDYLAWAEVASRFAERRRFAGAGVSHAQLASLALEHVYVEPDLESDQSRRRAAAAHERPERARLAGSQQQSDAPAIDRRPLREVAHRQRLVICGDTGMGKTTLLQHREREAIAVAQGAADAPIPVRVSVAEFPADGGVSLGAYALEQLCARWRDRPESTQASLSAAVVDHLERGRILLLVDGLNEAQAAKSAVVNALDLYLESHPTAAIVLATRQQAYDVPLRGGIEVWHLAPLDDRQRGEFLSRNMTGRPELPTVRRLFEENSRLSDLGRNPFFLVLGSLLAQAHLSNVHHRVQLYEKAFDRFWPRVDEDGIAWRRAIFAHVAASQRAERKAADQAPRLASRIDEARKALAAATETTAEVQRQALKDAGLLVQEPNGALAFFHPSFQEYLAAVHATRCPIAEIPERLRALRADPDATEVLLLALGRLAHVLDDPAQAHRALVALAAGDDPTETIAGTGVLTAWQAIRDGVTDDEVAVGAILARLAARVREIPDSRASEALALALLQFEETAAARDEVLDELILLVEAGHPVPWMARRYALQVVALAAQRDERAAAACRRAWERLERQDLPEGVAAAMLVRGAKLDESMLRPLARSLEQGWLEAVAEALSRDVVRHGASIRRLAASATDQDAAVCVTLALLARRDEEAIEAALIRHLEKYDMGAGRAIAYLASRQERILARVLERAAESKERARLVALTVGRGLAPRMVSKHVVPWLLAARLECATAWMDAIADGRVEAEVEARTALHEALRAALEGPPATAARAAALLTTRMPLATSGDVIERLAAAAPALVTRVDGAAACELLGALGVARLAEPMRALLARIVRTADVATLPSVLRNVNPRDLAERQIVVDRMTESAASRDQRTVLVCARFLAYERLAQAEVVAALRLVDEEAPLSLRAEAALLLVRYGVHDVGIARTLARALAARVDPREGFRFSGAIGEVVRTGNLRDEESFRLLIDGFMARRDDAPFESGEALRALLRNDDVLFEIALDALAAAAEPAGKKLALALVWCLLSEWRHADPADERLLLRFEARFAGSPLMFQEIELFAYGRPSWYAALDRALADVDSDPEDALDAASRLGHLLVATDGAAEVGTEGERHPAGVAGDEVRARRRARVVLALRQLLEHDAPHVALQAASELMFLGERDVREALHRALGGPPLVIVRAALALYGLGTDDDRLVAPLSTCLSSDVSTAWPIPERLFAQERLDAFDHGPEGLDALGDKAEGLATRIAVAPTVSELAAWLLVALRRDEVVPLLLNWVEGEDDGRRYQALAMLEQFGRGAAPRVVAWRLRQLRDDGWIRRAGNSHWLWSNAPEVLEHVDVLVDLFGEPEWRRETLRDWLTQCCTERDDWADRVATLAESRPAPLAVELAVVLARVGRVTESLGVRTVAITCEANGALPRRLLAEFVAAIDAHAVLAAAWRQRLAPGTVAARVAVATLLWQGGDGAPFALRDAMAEAFRAGLADEDLRVRLDALQGLEHLDLVDDSAALAARRILDATVGDAPTRVIDGELAERAAWQARASTIRRPAALLLLAWGREIDAATRWLVEALRAPWSAWDLEQIVDALRVRAQHDEVLRASLAAWLREHPPGTPGEAAIVARAQQLGVAADVLDRWALVALGVPSAHEACAKEILFGTKLADDHDDDPFLRRHSRDRSERAQYWARRIGDEGIDEARASRLVGIAIGAAPETIGALVASRSKKRGGEALAAVAEFVRRRADDGFVEELGRALLRRWVGQRISAG